MRMRVRQQRLQEIYKSLGKEPEAKELEIKAMISDFDKVGRKQLTRLRKAKHERLPQRANNLTTYGLRSRERTSKYKKSILIQQLSYSLNRLQFISCLAIDEEFVSQLKLVEADMKRMQGIFVAYKEQKPDLSKKEDEDRTETIKFLREAFRILKDDFAQQTKQFEMGGGYRQVQNANNSNYLDQIREDPMTTLMTDNSNIGLSVNASQQ